MKAAASVMVSQTTGLFLVGPCCGQGWGQGWQICHRLQGVSSGSARGIWGAMATPPTLVEFKTGRVSGTDVA